MTYAEAEALADAQRLTRSGLYTAAVPEYLARDQADAVTEALDALYASELSKLDPDLSAASAKAIQRSECR